MDRTLATDHCGQDRYTEYVKKVGVQFFYYN